MSYEDQLLQYRANIARFLLFLNKIPDCLQPGCYFCDLRHTLLAAWECIETELLEAIG